MNRGAGALRARMEKIAVPRSAPKPQRAKRQGGDGRLESASIANFQPVSAPRSMAQEDTLDFLASVHASCDESRDKRHYDALFNKFGCSSSRVKQREYFAEEVLDMPGSLPNLEARQNVHSKHAKHIFNDAFLANELPPDAIFHVTCTGTKVPLFCLVLQRANPLLFLLALCDQVTNHPRRPKSRQVSGDGRTQSISTCTTWGVTLPSRLSKHARPICQRPTTTASRSSTQSSQPFTCTVAPRIRSRSSCSPFSQTVPFATTSPPVRSKCTI